MDDNHCANCKHFHQHYTMRKKVYSLVGWGHCATPRMKARKSETAACAHFEPIRIYVPRSFRKK